MQRVLWFILRKHDKLRDKRNNMVQIKVMNLNNCYGHLFLNKCQQYDTSTYVLEFGSNKNSLNWRL